MLTDECSTTKLRLNMLTARLNMLTDECSTTRLRLNRLTVRVLICLLTSVVLLDYVLIGSQRVICSHGFAHLTTSYTGECCTTLLRHMIQASVVLLYYVV